MWPFNRKKESPKMEWDLKVGDEVECVASGRWSHVEDDSIIAGPEEGDILRVKDITAHPAQHCGFGLLFEPWDDAYFSADLFRKVRPTSIDERAEFKEIMKTARPAPVDA